MSDDEYVPLIDKVREPESRVHQELTKMARGRLATITDDWGRHAVIAGTDDNEQYKHQALKDTMKLVGREAVAKHYDLNDEYSAVTAHYQFIKNGKTAHVLTYIEQLAIQKESKSHRERAKKGIDVLEEQYGPPEESGSYEDISRALVTEGILWEIEWAPPGGVIQFRKIESEAMGEMDKKVRAFAENDPWDNALKGYNDAFDRYLNGDFDENIPKKLYFSIEEILKTICVDLEGWTDNREMNHSEYLKLLREHDFYRAHGATTAELGDFLDSLHRMVAKVSDDRKQRHAYHDRAYATLLIHQVGAYLYFLISRYDDFNSQ